MDNLGAPVPGAVVDVVPTGGFHHVVSHATTDQEGRFAMEGLGWTEFRVRAKKEGDGYPDTSFSIFANGSAQIVKLSPEAPIGTVTVRLGPKAAAITPSFADSETGDSIRANMRIWVWDSPDICLSTTRQPSPDLLIPAGRRVGIEFSAAGYDPWRYPDGSGAGQPLLIGAGERQAIKVGIRRSAAMRELDSRLLQPGISETEILDVVTEMFTAAPADPRTANEIVKVVKQRGSTTLPIAILGKFLPEPLVSECLDSASPEVRQAALAALNRHGIMVAHLAAKLRAIAVNPAEAPQAQGQARRLLDSVH